MTDALREHLSRCELAMQSAKQILGSHQFPTDKRTLTVIGFISWLVEHQDAILLLAMHNMAGSASALVRPVVEGAYRALWINLPATDAEIERFNKKDKIDPKFWQIAETLDIAYSMGDFFVDFKNRTWNHLNSYTHGGMHQIGRRFLNGEVASNYSDQQIAGIATSVTTLVLLTISFFLKTHAHVDSGDQIQALLGTFGAAAHGQSNP